MKTASLVFFAFGEDSYINRLAHETVPLWLGLEGYDRSVLLQHETKVGPFALSASDSKYATVVDIPTKENLVRHLNDLAEFDAVDVFVFSHGWTNKFRTSNGSYGDNTTVTGSYLEANVQARNLRAVWQCNCYGSTLNDTWIKLGAKAVAGSRFVNFYPTRWSGFIKAWREGVPFGEAVLTSDTKLVHTPVQIYIPADAMSRLKEWDGTVFQAPTVLGKSEAAERYFRTCWLGDDWQEGKSGAQNMNYSSWMIVGGDRALRKES